jgi:hypothetical protein
VATSLPAFWAELNTEFVTWDYADFLAHVSGVLVNDAATYLQWWNPDGPCIVNRLAVFEKGYVLTDAQKAQASRWSNRYGTDCGAGTIEAVTHLGEVVTHDGDVVFY